MKATTALAVLMSDAPAVAAFEPGPARPVSELGGARTTTKWQDAIVERDRAGEDAEPRQQSFRNLVAMAMASDAAGPPTRSSSKWMGDKETIVGGTGLGGHDPLNGRERISKLPQLLVRVAVAIERTRRGRRRVVNGIPGVMQVRIALLLVGGMPFKRNIHVGASLDAADRAAARRAKKKGKAMAPPPKRKPYIVIDCEPVHPGKVAEMVAGWGGIISARGVAACANEVIALAHNFAPAGWLVPLRHQETEMDEPQIARSVARVEEEMGAPAGYISGWKAILAIVGCSEKTARKLMARKERRLPVAIYLGNAVARESELREWQDAEIAAAIAGIGSG